MNELLFDNMSIQGFSHKRIEKECQDSSLSFMGEGFGGILVCDGHGGDKYIRSAYGSKIACEVGREKITEFMEHVSHSNKKLEENFVRLENAIVSEWRSRMEAHYTAFPLCEDGRFSALEKSDQDALMKNPIKAYGSTFIAAVMTDEMTFVLKLGDGNALLFYEDGTVEMPSELEDEELQFNVTTSLCNSDAAMCFHHCCRNYADGNRVAGITLTSDGVINCYPSENAYISFMENIFFAYGEEPDTTKEELLPVLDTLSEKGSGDDLSVSVLRIPMSEDEKMRMEEKQKREEEERIRRKEEREKAEREVLLRKQEEAARAAEETVKVTEEANAKNPFALEIPADDAIGEETPLSDVAMPETPTETPADDMTPVEVLDVQTEVIEIEPQPLDVVDIDKQLTDSVERPVSDVDQQEENHD